MSMELLFCKSKVFVHPSKSSQDNIPGFLIITLEQGQPRQECVLAWVPESALDKKQLNWLYHADLTLGNSELQKLKMDPGTLGGISSMAWSFSERR